MTYNQMKQADQIKLATRYRYDMLVLGRNTHHGDEKMAAANITFDKVSDTEYTATGNCVFGCGPYTTAPFPATALFAYNNGAFIQDALRMLSGSDREFILSGISPKGWEGMEAEED